MADFTQIIQEINDDINTNGVGAITGAKLNEVLRDMIAAVNAEKTDILPDGALYGGFAWPNEPPTYGDDHRYFYLAFLAGSYPAFDTELTGNILAMFYWLEDLQEWTSNNLTMTPTGIEELLSPKMDTVELYTRLGFLRFSPYSTYSVGDYVVNEGILYKFTANHPAGQWDDNDVAEASLVDYITDYVSKQLSGKQDTISDLATIRSGAAAGATAIQSSEKGANGGVATLDSGGKVPQSQLPSYVDDVLEYSNLASFPATGESGKIYVALDTNKTYRWSGSAYVEISQSLAIGETESTAFAGNRGKAIEDKIPSSASSSNKLATASDVNGKLSAPSTAGTSGQVLTSDGQGGQSWQTPTSGGVSDVTVGGTSVVSGGVAVVPAIPTVPTISTDIASDATSDTKTTSPKAVKTFVENKGYGTYSKPSGGIPASDLASGVIPNSVVNATSQQDGTVVLTMVNGDTITIDLNHQHPNYYSKVAETTQPSGGMLPDVIYKLGTLTGATTFTFAAAVSGNLNHYYFTFTSGSTAVVPTWPASITSWNGNCVDSTTGLPVIAANKTYEVSVLDGNAIIKEW